MNLRLILLQCATLTLFACAIMTESNSLIIDAATRQAVFRYVDAGDTEAAKQKRAAEVVETVRVLDEFLEGSPTATADALLEVVRAHVQWDRLTPADRLLVLDVLTLAEASLRSKQDAGLLSPEATVAVRALLRTAVNTALLL